MKKKLLLLLFAAGLSNAQIFSENFNGGALPSGWTVNNSDTAFNWGGRNAEWFRQLSKRCSFF